jgi:1-acyl-sn-glycerol-3-phosphate acyltransferase
MPRGLVWIQALLGIGAYLTLCIPYLKRLRGLERLRPIQRYLFVANHVSLLDTILLGGVCWRSGLYPILVLGDKATWHASLVKRLLSQPIGYLLERGKLNPGRIHELENFGRASALFHLVVYPEGTRGDGLHVGPCKPGLYHIAQAAGVPMVPLFIVNMQLISTKTGKFRLLAGWRKVEIHFGPPIPPATYLPMSREEFTEFVRERIAALQPMPPAERSSLALPPAESPTRGTRHGAAPRSFLR